MTVDEVDDKTTTTTVFEVRREAAELSGLVAGLLSDLDLSDDADPIPVPNIGSATMARVVDFVEQSTGQPGGTGSASSSSGWDMARVRSMPKDDLFDLIHAASYLDVAPLFAMGIDAVAELVRHKSTAEIREFFDIANDMTEQEEAQVKRELEWLFD